MYQTSQLFTQFILRIVVVVRAATS